MSTGSIAAPPPRTASLSQAERVLDAYLAPSKTFEDIRGNASWWLPLLLMVICALATGYTVDKRVGFERAYLNHLHTTPSQEDRINQLAPDQKANSIALGAKITEAATYAFPLLLLIGFAFYSLILWAAFNFILGAETTFSQVYAVSWYAALPYVFITVLTIVTICFGGSPETYDYANPIGTNLAYYFPDLSPGPKALLTALDLIKLWSLGLQVLGMAIIARKSILQSAIIVVGWFALLLVLAVGLAAAFS
jgi:hypothetical protein